MLEWVLKGKGDLTKKQLLENILAVNHGPLNKLHRCWGLIVQRMPCCQMMTLIDPADHRFVLENQLALSRCPV